MCLFFFFQAEDGIRDVAVTGVQTCALPILLADTTPPPGDSTVRVVVRVSEAPRHRIRAGAGYGSLDCFRVQSGWTAYDFLGGARSLDLTGQLSKLGVGIPADAGFKRNVCQPLHDDPTSDTANYNATLTLRQPAFLSPRHTASFAVFAERRSEFKARSEEHTSELQSRLHLVCRLLLEKKKKTR